MKNFITFLKITRMGLVISIISFLLLSVFGALAYFGEYKKGQKVSGIYKITMLVFALLLAFGVWDIVQKDSDSQNSTKSILSAIDKIEVGNKRPALIDLFQLTPTTINPQVYMSHTQDTFDVATSIINKGGGVAFDIMESPAIVYVLNGEVFGSYRNPNAPIGPGKDFFISPQGVNTITSHFILKDDSIKYIKSYEILKKNISERRDKSRMYYCLKINYSDSLVKGRSFKCVFWLNQPNKVLEFADSKTYERIDEYLVRNMIW